MIEIRTAKGEVELSGTPEELALLKSLVRAFVEGKSHQMSCSAESHCDPKPYDAAMAEFCLVRGHGRNLFEINGAILRLTGSTECLKNFADNIPAARPKGDHIHYDSISLSDVIDERSPDLVIAVK
jgi:hypothetical protein